MLPPSSTMFGWRCLTRPTAQRYQSAHRPLPWPVGQLAGVQPSRSSGTTARWSCHAISRTAGSHMYACESPIRTMSFLLELSPRRQILVAITGLLSWPRHFAGSV